MEKILITGANGFIGSHVTEYFCSKGYRIGCLVRKESDLTHIMGLDVQIHYSDIRNEENLIDILKSYDSVIHIAALARDWGTYKDFYEINVGGTLNVLKACQENGIDHIFLTSSCSVYGEENCLKMKNEDSPLNSHYHYFLDKIFPCKLNYYRDTKRIAKEKAINLALENNLNITFIEPVWVFGERELHSGFYEYMKTAQSKIPFLPGSKENHFHIVYVQDLAAAYWLVYKKKLQGIHSFLIGNKNAVKMESIYTLFCNAAGFNKPKNLPKWLTYPLGFILELFYTLINGKNAPLLTRGRVNMFYDSIAYSIKKAHEILQFENKYTLEESIKKTVDWYQNNGLL